MKEEDVKRMANDLIKEHLSEKAIRRFYTENDFRPFLMYDDEQIVEYLTEDWKFEISNSIQNPAETDYDTATISMSSVFARNLGEADIYEVLIHEIAHALCPKEGHNWIWKSICRSLGQEPTVYTLWSFPEERNKQNNEY